MKGNQTTLILSVVLSVETNTTSADLCVCVFVCVCFGRCRLPSVPAGPGGGEAVQRGAAAERGEEHPEERHQPAHGSAAAAAGSDARGQEAKVGTDSSSCALESTRLKACAEVVHV